MPKSREVRLIRCGHDAGGRTYRRWARVYRAGPFAIVRAVARVTSNQTALPSSKLDRARTESDTQVLFQEDADEGAPRDRSLLRSPSPDTLRPLGQDRFETVQTRRRLSSSYFPAPRLLIRSEMHAMTR